MKQETREDHPTVESAEELTMTKAEDKDNYELHVLVPRQMQQTLKDAADLASRLGLIEKPELKDLMNFFINYGMAILKKTWLERAGYR